MDKLRRAIIRLAFKNAGLMKEYRLIEFGNNAYMVITKNDLPLPNANATIIGIDVDHAADSTSWLLDTVVIETVDDDILISGYTGGLDIKISLADPDSLDMISKTIKKAVDRWVSRRVR
jgi:hypothetical protein